MNQKGFSNLYTPDGAGIDDNWAANKAYVKQQVGNTYSQGQINTLLDAKANVGAAYVKAESDARYLTTTASISQLALATQNLDLNQKRLTNMAESVNPSDAVT